LFVLKQKQKVTHTSYHHYSPAPSRGLRATKEETSDASESTAARTIGGHKMHIFTTNIPTFYSRYRR
jgi:hypothetical protein